MMRNVSWHGTFCLLLALAGCDHAKVDLPPEFAGAEQISISQDGCNDSSILLHTEYLVLNQPDRLTYRNAHFRCSQDLCGYALQQENEYHVLVQPCDMDPESVAACDCLNDVGIPIQIPGGPKSVKVWRRWDHRASQSSSLVAIGEIEVTLAVSCNNGRQDGEEVDVDCGGSGDCKRCGPGMGCVGDEDCESVHCGGGQCQKA